MIRELLQRVRIPILVALVLVLAVVLLRNAQKMKVEPVPVYVKQAWFFDLNTGRLFKAPRDNFLPMETESGPFEGAPAGVRAHVFSCTGCSDREEAFIGWLFKPDMEAVADADGRIQFMVREPDGHAWHYSESPEGMAITDLELCPEGHEPHYCWPDSELIGFEEPKID